MISRLVREGKHTTDEVIVYMQRYIYKWMRDNKYFVKYLNKLTKEQLLKIKMYLIGAVLFYQYYNVKDNG